MWDRRVVEFVEECIGNFSIASLFKNVEDRWEWAYASTQGANLDSDRRLLWEELVGLYYLWDVPWYMSGDFNITRFPSK